VVTHLSLFSGIGGFDLGFEIAGIETVAQVESNKYCRMVLQHHWPNVPRYADIKEFNGYEWRGVDIITGGFPCQDLSVAGRREGIAGARSSLFFEMCRVVEEAQPRLVIWENVPGLLSADNGRAMATIIESLANIGYSGCWRVLDSQFFGVPQQRRRVFGAFATRSAGGWACGAAILFEPKGSSRRPPKSCGTRAKVAKRSATCPGGNSQKVQTFPPDIAYTCTADDANGVSTREYVNTFVVDGSVRRLTPLERERLQGFPDGWTKVDGVSNKQRYRQIGNAVTTNVAYWLGLRAKTILGDK